MEKIMERAETVPLARGQGALCVKGKRGYTAPKTPTCMVRVFILLSKDREEADAVL